MINCPAKKNSLFSPLFTAFRQNPQFSLATTTDAVLELPYVHNGTKTKQILSMRALCDIIVWFPEKSVARKRYI